MDIFATILDLGYTILEGFSTIFDYLSKPISELIPDGFSDLISSVPFLTEFLNTSFGVALFGGIVTIILGYTIVRWLIP